MQFCYKLNIFRKTEALSVLLSYTFIIFMFYSFYHTSHSYVFSSFLSDILPLSSLFIFSYSDLEFHVRFNFVFAHVSIYTPANLIFPIGGLHIFPFR